VIREINVLRPPQRRRIFFVLSRLQCARWMRTPPFSATSICVVNVTDVDELLAIMEVALREYNELYREF
jgi:hypothetical protein